MIVGSIDAPHVSDAPSPHQVVMVSAVAPGHLRGAVELAHPLFVSQCSGFSPWFFRIVQPLDEPRALPVHDSPGDSIP